MIMKTDIKTKIKWRFIKYVVSKLLISVVPVIDRIVPIASRVKDNINMNLSMSFHQFLIMIFILLFIYKFLE